MNPHTNAIIAIQRQIFEQAGQRTDVHYEEGKGALFVPEGLALIPQNVILAVDEIQLRLMRI